MTTPTALALDRSDLTPRQRQVYDALEKGLGVPEIAKKLRLTRAAVYNHMRSIRKRGVTLPNEQLSPNGSQGSAEPVSANGSVSEQVVETLRQAAAHTEKAIHAISEESEQIAARITDAKAELEGLEADRLRIEAEHERYRRAMEALVV